MHRQILVALIIVGLLAMLPQTIAKKKVELKKTAFNGKNWDKLSDEDLDALDEGTAHTTQSYH